MLARLPHPLRTDRPAAVAIGGAAILPGGCGAHKSSLADPYDDHSIAVFYGFIVAWGSGNCPFLRAKITTLVAEPLVMEPGIILLGTEPPPGPCVEL